ncbi:hypothetical protein [[Enterobacter] lignolyticus]|uniref:hypothetical protein n=1 Tax=[Enterobacter] lignolyticus TaxID=1334193 RepID=UPI001969D063|nr:hypothetical protein [[Enterobacter] lignolyticus]
MKKANDYLAFSRAFSTDVCAISLNFADGGEEIDNVCANVIVCAQSGNTFVQNNERNRRHLPENFCRKNHRFRWQIHAQGIELKCQHNPEPPTHM